MNRLRLATARVLAAIVGVTAISFLVACEVATYEYHNPLDPKEDATVAETLAAVSDAELRRAISDSVNNETERSKREVHWVHAAFWDPQPQGYAVSNLSGIEFFPQVSGLELGGNTLDWEANLPSLQQLPRLHDLFVDRTGVTDTTLELFTQLDQLRYLGLRENTITIEGLRALVGSSIEGISLSPYDDVGDNPGYQLTSGASVFDELDSSRLADQLWGIDLGGFQLTATDLTGLRVFPHLGSLGLWSNQIESVVEINDYLRFDNDADYPLHLGLGNNPILKTELEKLDLSHLSGLDIGHMGTDGLLLTAVPAFTTGGAEFRDLGLQDNLNMASLDGLSQLLSNSPIEHLNLSRTAITDVTPLLYGDELRWVYLSNITSSEGSLANVEDLVGLKNLQHLNLYGTPLANDAAVRAAFDERPDILVEYPDGSTNQQ